MNIRRQFPSLATVGALAALALGAPRFAYAVIIPLPQDLAEETLSESVPTAFAPNDLEADDFAVEWVSPPIQGVEIGVEKNSLEWVRVATVLVMPRGRLHVRADDVDGARVTNARFSQSLEINDRKGEAFFPIALISGSQNPIEVVIARNGKEYRGTAIVRFKPRSPSETARVYYDASCSSFGVSAESVGFRQDEWAFVGCRMVDSWSSEHRTPSLEVLVYWDNVGQTIRVGGVDTPATSNSVWPLRLRAAPGHTKLKAGTHEMTLSYRIPKILHRAGIGMGIGPYAFSFRGNGEDMNSWVIMPTFYGSFFVTEAIRIVAFDATTINKFAISDFGIYLSSEYVRTLDRRIALYPLLGAHAIGFWSGGKYYLLVGAPQGMEVVFTDFLKPARNLSFGGFLYPEIDGKSYYNTWVRWGSGKLFIELNYIAWKETIGSDAFSAKSAGVTVGFPLPFLRFL